MQVGANTIAFPRAAAMAFWGWLIGSGLVVAAYAVDGGPVGSRAKAVDLSYAGLALVLAALIVATVCVLTTVIALRTPGLWLDRMPMFSWSMVVAGTLWLLTLPVLLANILLIYIDHHYGRPALFGIGSNQWPQLSWAFAQPADLRRGHPGARHHQRRGRPPCRVSARRTAARSWPPSGRSAS